jgi:hypothetical protein
MFKLCFLSNTYRTDIFSLQFLYHGTRIFIELYDTDFYSNRKKNAVFAIKSLAKVYTLCWVFVLWSIFHFIKYLILFAKKIKCPE